MSAHVFYFIGCYNDSSDNNKNYKELTNALVLDYLADSLLPDIKHIPEQGEDNIEYNQPVALFFNEPMDKCLIGILLSTANGKIFQIDKNPIKKIVISS